MSINLFLESLWSFVPGQVLKSGCPILSIMEDLLLILHLIPWTLCAFFFFHQMKIIGLPSVEVCIASNALYSTSTLIIKSYFVCKESLKQRKKLKVCYWVMSVRWQNRKLWILHLPNILIQPGHEDKNPFVRYPETGSKLCVTLCVCALSCSCNLGKQETRETEVRRKSETPSVYNFYPQHSTIWSEGNPQDLCLFQGKEWGEPDTLWPSVSGGFPEAWLLYCLSQGADGTWNTPVV